VTAQQSPWWTELTSITLHVGGLAPGLGLDGIRHVLTQPADFPDGTGRGRDPLAPFGNLLDLLPSGRGDRYRANTCPVIRIG
jgi:hypothetical protein